MLSAKTRCEIQKRNVDNEDFRKLLDENEELRNMLYQADPEWQIAEKFFNGSNIIIATTQNYLAIYFKGKKVHGDKKYSGFREVFDAIGLHYELLELGFSWENINGSYFPSSLEELRKWQDDCEKYKI